MAGQRTITHTVKLVVGCALAGLGLFILFGHLVGMVDQVRALEGNVAGHGLSVFSSVVLSATLVQHGWLQALLGLLWPLLLVIAGAVLLKDDKEDCQDGSRRVRAAMPDPCASEGC